MPYILIHPNDLLKTKTTHGIDIADVYKRAGVDVNTRNVREGFSDVLFHDQRKASEYLEALKLVFRQDAFVEFPELELLFKDKTKNLLQKAELPYLEEAPLLNLDSIINFPSDNIFIKPVVGSFSLSTLPFAYTVISKQEALDQINSLQIDLDSISPHIIQEALPSISDVLWVGGYVDKFGNIAFEGVLDQKYEHEPRNALDPDHYPNKHRVNVVRETKDNFNTQQQDLVDQVTRIISFYKIIMTPFCIQGMVDSNGRVKLIDFNFGWGKGYALVGNSNNTQYLIDRIRYMFFNEPFIRDDKFRVSCQFDFPDGISDEVDSYLNDNGLMVGFVSSPYKNRFSYLKVSHHYVGNIAATCSTHEEAVSKLRNFSEFINQPLPDYFI